MIHDLKPYPSYKDSGVPWIGKVPEHWNVVPNRAHLILKKKVVGTSFAKYTLLSLTKQGVIARDLENPEGKFPASFDTYQEVKSGDLIFCLFDIDETPRTVGLSTLEGMITGAYTVFECTDPEAARFIYLFYLAMDNSKHLKPLYTGLRKVITKATFLSAKMPLPPSDEQSAIARYLDHIDRRTRHYIRAKKKLIKLLEEQKQAIIHQAVTRGLDPNVKLKPSGVEWLGDVPKHWEVLRVKQISRVLRGKFTHRPRNDPVLYDGPYPFIQTGEVARASKEITSFKQTLNDRGFAVSKMFPRGTLVMTIAANIGDVAVLDFEACFPDSIVGFVPHDFVERDFLFYVFKAMKPELLREAPVNTQGNLNIDRIGSRAIGLPDLTEQKEIVHFIEENTTDLEKIIVVTNREISLLREYRTRLIADIVTGKLDVKEAAANLPEEAGETESYDDALAEDEELESNKIEGDQAGELEDEVLA